MTFAHKGDVITCPNGHEIATLAGDLCRGQLMMSALFTDWREGQTVAKTGELITPCKCGERYIRSGPNGGWQIHFKDGWRP